ncbi:MAG: NAD(P)/FAD-dependent oxidoreductase, partial [Luteibaculaceae bacterium]
MDTKKRPKIVIVGAGFAGIQLVQNIDDNAYDIVLLDKVNHHMFQPLFYQVATSQIEPSSISFPIRKIISGRKNTQFRLANVYAVNQEAKQLETSIGIITYDKLIISIGCKTNFFGNKVTEENSLTLKTTFEAISIRNHILKVYERILSAPKEELEGLNNLVIVGAGPTGVELAGAFAEIRNNILPKDYPRIDFSKFKV